MRAASTIALLSSLAISAQAGSNSPAHQRQAIARRAEASSASATPTKHVRGSASSTTAAVSSTVTAKAQKVNAAADSSTALPLTEYTYSALSGTYDLAETRKLHVLMSILPSTFSRSLPVSKHLSLLDHLYASTT